MPDNAQIVQQHGGDEDDAIAAVLHDTLEDFGAQLSAEQIEAQFGKRVRDFVQLSSFMRWQTRLQ